MKNYFVDVNKYFTYHMIPQGIKGIPCTVLKIGQCEDTYFYNLIDLLKYVGDNDPKNFKNQLLKKPSKIIIEELQIYCKYILKIIQQYQICS